MKVSPDVEVGDVPMDKRLVRQLSQATVKDPIDAIVELVTNSHDAYTRSGYMGDIDILMKLMPKGGHLLAVRDEACGMSYDQLMKALVFGGRTSGQKVGSGIRGLFGRGLKEAILGLGRGSVITCCNGEVSKLYLFSEDGNSRFKAERHPSPKLLSSELSKITGLRIPKDHGTVVLIQIEKEITTPREGNLEWQIENHYALRKILQAGGREIRLLYQTKGGAQNPKVLEYRKMQLKKVLEKDLTVPGLSRRIHLTVNESQESLDPERSGGMTYSKAGILVLTEGVPVDNQLWQFRYEDAAYYFNGELDVPSFAEMWEKDDFSVLTPQRDGLDWRKSSVCKSIEKICVEEIAPLVAAKKDFLTSRGQPVEGKRKEQIGKVCEILNDLAEELEAELEPFGGDGHDRFKGLKGIVVVPDFVGVMVGKVRPLTIYARSSLAVETPAVASVELSGPGVALYDSEVELHPIPDEPTVLRGYFRVEGKTLGQKVTGKATLTGHDAFTTIEVVKEEKRGRKKKKREGRGGPFADIRFSQDSNPIQPVKYFPEKGAIEIFIEFPHVKLYIGEGGSGVESPSGRTLFAELVGEAFCRYLTVAGLESGKYPKMSGAEIYGYESAFNKLRLSAMKRIHTEVGTILASIK